MRFNGKPLFAFLEVSGAADTQDKTVRKNFASSSANFKYNNEILPMLPSAFFDEGYSWKVIIRRANGRITAVASTTAIYKYENTESDGTVSNNIGSSGTERYAHFDQTAGEWGEVLDGNYRFAFEEIIWSFAGINDKDAGGAYYHKSSAPIPVTSGGGMFVQNYYSCAFVEGFEKIAAGEYFPKQHTFLTTTSGRRIRKGENDTVDLMGQFPTTYPRAEMIRQAIQSGDNHCGGVVVGTGNEEPTLEDYKMGAVIATEDITITPDMVYPFVDAGEIGIVGIYTLQNNTEADIAVREVGLYAQPNGYYEDDLANEQSYWFTALFERTLLDKPIMVAAGGTAMLVYVVYP